MPTFGRSRLGKANPERGLAKPIKDTSIQGTKEYLSRKVLTSNEALIQPTNHALVRVVGIPRDVVGESGIVNGVQFFGLSFTIDDRILACMKLNDPQHIKLSPIMEPLKIITALLYAERKEQEIEVCGLIYPMTAEMELGYLNTKLFGQVYQNTDIMREHLNVPSLGNRA